VTKFNEILITLIRQKDKRFVSGWRVWCINWSL